MIHRAINDEYGIFLSGLTTETDLLFARLVLEFQAEYPVQLEAVIPFARRIKCHDPEFQSLLTRCSAVRIISKHYSPGCFSVKNRYMVDRSEALIAVYDGRQSGGTYRTICYARTVGRKITFVCMAP